MKAISLWEPFGSLLAAGLKKYETRGWKTDYRGLIAIHAAKRKIQPDDLKPMMGHWQLQRFLYPTPNSHKLYEPPYGCVIAVCELLDCQPTEALSVSAQERAVGDWSPGRWAWELDVVRVLPQPIPARGYQNIWNWTPPESSQETPEQPI